MKEGSRITYHICIKNLIFWIWCHVSYLRTRFFPLILSYKISQHFQNSKLFQRHFGHVITSKKYISVYIDKIIDMPTILYQFLINFKICFISHLYCVLFYNIYIYMYHMIVITMYESTHLKIKVYENFNIIMEDILSFHL